MILILVTSNHHLRSSSLLTNSIDPMLMPIVKEESKAITLTIINSIKELAKKSTRCEVLCNGTGPLTVCKTKTGLSTCKAICQETKQIGGYEIKLRYWDKGSITNCLKAAVKSGLQTADGKANTRSIAIYSQEDLNLLIELISYITAAEKVITSKGSKLDIKVDTKEIDDARQHGTYSGKASNQEIARLIKDDKSKHAFDNAVEVKKHAEAQIVELVKTGRFGNQ